VLCFTSLVENIIEQEPITIPTSHAHEDAEKEIIYHKKYGKVVSIQTRETDKSFET
jgi:hypothetical protein